MTEDTKSQPEGVYHADGFSGFDISEDGTMVRMKLQAGDGFVNLLMPSGGLPALSLNLQMLLDSLVLAGVLPPGLNKPLRSAQKWKVGQSDDKRLAKFTMLVFDEGLQQEVCMMLTDVDALKLADAIEQKVLNALPLEQQRQMIQSVEAARPRAKGTLILPPGKH